MRVLDPAELSRSELNGLVNGLVAPRPIAWVSTIADDGTRNLAPFSFFNAFSFSPPVVAVGPGCRLGVHKDSLANIKATGEFTVSVVTEALAERANLSSAEFPPDVNEWEIAGVDPAQSVAVRPPRVAQSPAAFECRVKTVVDLGRDEAPSNSLVIGSVLRIHVLEEALDGLVPLPAVLGLVGRLGGPLWCTTRDRFVLHRPTSRDPDEVRLARDGPGSSHTGSSGRVPHRGSE